MTIDKGIAGEGGGIQAAYAIKAAKEELEKGPYSIRTFGLCVLGAWLMLLLFFAAAEDTGTSFPTVTVVWIGVGQVIGFMVFALFMYFMNRQNHRTIQKEIVML